MARLARILPALAVASALALAGCSTISDAFGGDGDEPERDEDGNVTASADSADVFAIGVGDCIGGFGDGDDVSELPVMPCDEPHEMEVFASLDVPDDGEFPGDEAVSTQAQEECTAAFEEFIGVAYDESELWSSFLLPTEDTWEQGDREILCTVYEQAEDGDPELITGSLEDANR